MQLLCLQRSVSPSLPAAPPGPAPWASPPYPRWVTLAERCSRTPRVCLGGQSPWHSLLLPINPSPREPFSNRIDRADWPTSLSTWHPGPCWRWRRCPGLALTWHHLVARRCEQHPLPGGINHENSLKTSFSNKVNKKILFYPFKQNMLKIAFCFGLSAS